MHRNFPARWPLIRAMAKRKTTPPEEPAQAGEHLEHWRTPLPEPIRLTRGRQLVTLLDAGRLVADSFPSTQSEAIDGTAKALMDAAASGEPEDIDFAVLVLRLLLQAHNMTDDPERERYKATKWRGRSRRRR